MKSRFYAKCVPNTIPVPPAAAHQTGGITAPIEPLDHYIVVVAEGRAFIRRSSRQQPRDDEGRKEAEAILNGKKAEKVEKSPWNGIVGPKN